MSVQVRNIIRFIVFLLVQVYLLDKVPFLHQFVKPYIYFLFILWLPFGMKRAPLMLVAFFFGLCLDYFNDTPGLHAAPCVLIAFVRPFLISILLPREAAEFNYSEPGPKSLGVTPYSIYVVILTFLHHAYLVFIEWLQFGNMLYFVGKVAATTAVSLLLIFIAELLFPRKGKYRTNAA